MNLRPLRSLLGFTAGVVCITLVAAGCSSSSSSKSTADGGSADGKCSTKDKVKVGIVVPLTGPIAQIGTEYRAGAELAISKANTAGGFQGKCLVAVAADDAGDPTTGAQVTRKLLQQDKVSFIEGSITSSVVQVQLPLVKQANKVLVQQALLASAQDAKTNPTVFNTTFSSATAVRQVVQYMQQRRLTKLGVMAVNAAYGISTLDQLNTVLGGTNITVVSKQFMQTGATDATPQIRALQAAKPDVMLLITSGSDLIPPLKARAAIGWDVPVLANNNVIASAITSAVGPAGIKGVNAWTISKGELRDATTGQPSATTAAFVKDLQAFTGKSLTSTISGGGYSYDGVAMIIDAAKAVDSFDGKKISDYLNSHPYTGVMGTYTENDTSHSGLSLDQLNFADASSLSNGTLLPAK